MDCTKCHTELDEASEETLAQINKYAETKTEPIFENCLLAMFENIPKPN
jgi:hypothetical protein